MSDPNAKPDPMDTAYAQAEALLHDEAERAARRTRVLAAIAREPAQPTASVSLSTGRSAWARGGWLAAASVAGLSVLLATQVHLPGLNRPPSGLATAPVPTPARGDSAAPKSVARASPEAAKAASPISAVAPQAPAPASDARPAVAPPPRVAPPPEASPMAEPSLASESRSEVVVTGARPMPATPPYAQARPADGPGDAAADMGRVERRTLKPAPSAVGPALSPGVAESVSSPADRAARLRAAAAAGRTADVADLLADGVPVDAVDADGETALMKSIQADHPAVAALLRRRGASLERQNHAGVSARAMARRVGDGELYQALGIEP